MYKMSYFIAFNLYTLKIQETSKSTIFEKLFFPIFPFVPLSLSATNQHQMEEFFDENVSNILIHYI